MVNKDTLKKSAAVAPNVLPESKKSRSKPAPKPTPLPTPDASWVHLTSPVGGEHWSLDTEQKITWESHKYYNNFDLVLLKFLGEIEYIEKNIPVSKGSYTWKVGRHQGPGIPPPCADPGGNYRICMKTADGKYLDYNEDPFTIDPLPSLVLTTPKGGIWQPENKLRISWKAEYFPSGTTVKLEIIEHISTVIDTFENIPIEKEFFTWDISQTPGIKNVMNYHIRIATMQEFFTDWFNKSEIEDVSDGLLSILEWKMTPFQTFFEGYVNYQKIDNFWARFSTSGPSTANFFHGWENGKTDPNVQNMMKDMVGSLTALNDDQQIWEKIGVLWDWLITPGNLFQTVDQSILKNISSIPNEWPSISDWAKYYKDHGKTLAWGTCNDKISLFANLLVQLQIPPEKFAIASARHNLQVPDPSVSTHFYMALNVDERWFYIDPLATCSNPPTKFPDFIHAGSVGFDEYNKNIDYQHPFAMELLKESLPYFVPYLPP